MSDLLLATGRLLRYRFFVGRDSFHRVIPRRACRPEVARWMGDVSGQEDHQDRRPARAGRAILAEALTTTPLLGNQTLRAEARGGAMSGLLSLVRAAAVIYLLLAFGCVSVPMAPLREDATAKEFDGPPPGSAYVYIIRSNSGIRSWAGAYPQVLVDGRFVGTMPQHTYVRERVIPGEHTVSILATSLPKADEAIDARDGRIYFVEVDLLIGAIHPSALIRRLDPEAGRAIVLRSKMLAR
jgi:hypothetical protein